MRLLLVLMLVVAAGCAGPPAHDDVAAPTPAATPGAVTPPTDGAFRPNVWLMDGIRPVSSTQVSSGAEPSILADSDGEFLWIGDTTGAYYSDDNGSTWRHMTDFLLPSVLGDGWALAQDHTGRLYAAGLIGSTIDVATSTDGKTWATVNRAAAVSGVTDRPWLAAQGDGEVVLFYYDYPLGEYCARSTDAGTTWLDRDPLAGAAQGGNAIYDDAGDFYYSEDGGVVTKFAGSCTGSSQSKQMFNGLGANNMIQLATDGEAIYAAAATANNKAIAVSGTKNLQTTRTTIVSPEILQSSTFATITAHGDQIAVAWYGSETPGDPSNPSFAGSFNVYVAIIDDFWGTPVVRNIRVTDEPNHVGDICMGGIGCDGNADRDLLDYFMMDYDKWGGLHIAYGHDGSGSNAVVRYAQIPASVARVPVEPDGSVDLPPVADFVLTANALSIRVDASGSTDPEGSALEYVWGWGDGTPNGQGKIATHTYDSYGAFTVTLTVTDTAGHPTATSQNILVEEAERTNLLPVADFSATDGKVGQAIAFTDLSKDEDGSITGWAWRFGDGGTSDLSSPTHAYNAAGQYNVTLTVIDDWGETAAATHIVTITADAAAVPVADDAAAGKASPGLCVVAIVAALYAVARRR